MQLFCYEIKNTVSAPTYVEYKLVLNGTEWICDPNVQTVRTDSGTLNNVFIMKPSSISVNGGQQQNQQGTQEKNEHEMQHQEQMSITKEQQDQQQDQQEQQTSIIETLQTNSGVVPQTYEEQQTVESKQSESVESIDSLSPTSSIEMYDSFLF